MCYHIEHLEADGLTRQERLMTPEAVRQHHEQLVTAVRAVEFRAMRGELGNIDYDQHPDVVAYREHRELHRLDARRLRQNPNK